MSRPTLAVLGAGRIAQMFHLRILAELDADVAVIAEPSAANRRDARGWFPGAQMVEDWPAAIRPEVDACLVILPTHLHAPAGVAAFESGKHVYVEKPLAPTLDDARHIEAAWRRARTVGMTGFNFRFQPLLLDARRRVAAGELGALVGIRGTVCSPPRDLPQWKRSRSSGGGALLDLAVHHLDLVPFVLDERITSVAAQLRSVRSEDDTVHLTATTSSGVVAQILASTASRQIDRLELFGDEQVLTIDRFRSSREEVAPVHAGGDRRARVRAGLAELGASARRIMATVAPSDEPSFRAALGAFLHAVATGVQTRPSIADGSVVAAVVDAAERSAANGGGPQAVG